MSDTQEAPLASLGLLRQITDRHVVDQLLATPAMTRAAIAAATGISKPTISESVRRLAEAGVLTEADSGNGGDGPARSGRRGPAGVAYALRPDLGCAVAVSAGPDGLVAETLDLRGHVLRRSERTTRTPVAGAELGPQLRDVVADALVKDTPPIRGAAVSVAGPVDRDTGRMIHLPNSPFLVDELDTRPWLEPLLGPVIVDNDVNWAATAEFHDGVAAGIEDLCYLHLGYGIGGAVVRHGQIVRGHAGLAGEPAHMLTVGPDGSAMRLVECFGALNLLQPGSEAIDTSRVIDVLSDTADSRRRDAIVDAVAGVIASITALLNPAGIVVGGPWTSAGDFLIRLTERVRTVAVSPVVISHAALGSAAPLTGARRVAVSTAQASLFLSA